jgi:hypothetical protein
MSKGLKGDSRNTETGYQDNEIRMPTIDELIVKTTGS